MASRVQIFSSSADFETPPPIPSMLSTDEKALYHHIACGYTGAGAVVELGPWMGSGTYQICRGLSGSGKNWTLTVIDRFQWNSLYEGRYPSMALKDGDSFEPLFRQNLAAFGDRITCIATELAELSKVYEPPAEIELLYVDAPKSWALLWMILNLFGPRLMPGARLVFQDYLHITSRQLIWLLASVRELTPTHVVSEGTTVAFVASGPIVDLARQVPSHISKLGSAQLLERCETAAGFLPESRAGELAVGAALDLIGRGDIGAAKRVLDGKARDKPWTPALNEQVARLIRYNDKSQRRALIEIAAYINAGVDPADVRAAWDAAASEDEADVLASLPDPLRHIEKLDDFRIGELLRRPLSARALAIRYAQSRPVGDATAGALTGLFEAVVKSGAVGEALQLEDDIRGKDVVALGERLATLKGVACAALGARSFTSVVPGIDPALRTYAGSRSGERFRTRYPLATLAELLPAVRFVDGHLQVPPKSADFILAEIETHDDAEAVADTIYRVARDGCKIRLHWRNPRCWSGHGGAPHRVADINRNDPQQAGVLDWRHLRKIDASLPTVEQVRQSFGGLINVERWSERLDDPAAMIRITPKVRSQNPGLALADLITASITVIGTLKAV